MITYQGKAILLKSLIVTATKVGTIYDFIIEDGLYKWKVDIEYKKIKNIDYDWYSYDSKKLFLEYFKIIHDDPNYSIF